MKFQEPKPAVRAETDALVEAFLAKGGRVDRAPAGESGNGWCGKEWQRAAQGLKVASGEEIAAERERRALVAVTNSDLVLALSILNFEFDKEIKFDLENERLEDVADGSIRRAIK